MSPPYNGYEDYTASRSPASQPKVSRRPSFSPHPKHGRSHQCVTSIRSPPGKLDKIAEGQHDHLREAWLWDETGYLKRLSPFKTSITVPIGGVSIRSMVNRVPYRPLLSWAAMQLFSMHRLCTEEGERKGDGYPLRQGPPGLFRVRGNGIAHRSAPQGRVAIGVLKIA